MSSVIACCGTSRWCVTSPQTAPSIVKMTDFGVQMTPQVCHAVEVERVRPLRERRLRAEVHRPRRRVRGVRRLVEVHLRRPHVRGRPEQLVLVGTGAGQTRANEVRPVGLLDRALADAATHPPAVMPRVAIRDEPHHAATLEHVARCPVARDGPVRDAGELAPPNRQLVAVEVLHVRLDVAGHRVGNRWGHPRRLVWVGHTLEERELRRGGAEDGTWHAVVDRRCTRRGCDQRGRAGGDDKRGRAHPRSQPTVAVASLGESRVVSHRFGAVLLRRSTRRLRATLVNEARRSPNTMPIRAQRHRSMQARTACVTSGCVR